MKKLKWVWWLVTLIPVIFIILGYVFPSTFFSSQEQIRGFIEPFGAFAFLAFIFLQVLQVVVTPINHYVVSIAGGFLFGPWWGSLFNWIGRAIGTAIAFILGRIFGKKIIRRLVKPSLMRKYDFLFEKGKVVLFFMYFLPLFPDDELSYLAGFSNINPFIFFVVMMLGHIGGSTGLAYIGAGISPTSKIGIISLVANIVVAGLFFIFYYRFKKKTA